MKNFDGDISNKDSDVIIIRERKIDIINTKQNKMKMQRKKTDIMSTPNNSRYWSKEIKKENKASK